jgi:hypothetical protein
MHKDCIRESYRVCSDLARELRRVRVDGFTHPHAVDWTAQRGNTMKNLIRISFGFAFLAVMVSASQVLAQAAVKETTTTTTTTTTEGTISQFGPNTIAVKTTTSPTPITYSYTKTTTYVDESGKPVSIETVKSGIPVTVYYDKSGDKMVATKVVVQKTTVTNPR